MNWDIAYTNTFKKNFKALPKYIQRDFFVVFELFQEDIYSEMLRTHELSGTMDGLLSSSIDGEYRFVTRVNTKNNMILL